jgi:hypothetical protein
LKLKKLRVVSSSLKGSERWVLKTKEENKIKVEEASLSRIKFKACHRNTEKNKIMCFYFALPCFFFVAGYGTLPFRILLFVMKGGERILCRSDG